VQLRRGESDEEAQENRAGWRVGLDLLLAIREQQTRLVVDADRHVGSAHASE